MIMFASGFFMDNYSVLKVIMVLYTEYKLCKGNPPPYYPPRTTPKKQP